MHERNLVNALLLRHWVGKHLPTDPMYLALAEGVACHCVGLADYGLGSAYVRETKGGTILYHPALPLTVQRYMVAHRLGHHLLGHPSQPFESQTPSTWDRTRSESQAAHRFAMELLMPIGSVQLLVIDQGTTDLGRLAGHFGVSEALMHERLQQLGYLFH